MAIDFHPSDPKLCIASNMGGTVSVIDLATATAVKVKTLSELHVLTDVDTSVYVYTYATGSEGAFKVRDPCGVGSLRHEVSVMRAKNVLER